MDCLNRFVTADRIKAAQLTAIGALRDVVLMYFDWDKKDYARIPVREQVEVASMIGDVAEDPDGNLRRHIHLVVGQRDGSTMRRPPYSVKHRVTRPTLEVVVNKRPVAPVPLDQESGVPPIRPAA